MTHSVFILEDHQATLASLRSSLDEDNRLCVAGTAQTLAEAHRWFETNPPPDVALIDLGLPDGRGETLIEQISNHVAVLVMTVFADEKAVIGAIKSGAIGYLLKERRGEQIADAVVEVINGGSPISPSIARYLLNHFNDDTNPQSINNPLTKRETQVLTLVVKGFSYKEMAESMSLSIHTVTSHVQNIYRKLSVTSRGEAVFEAVQLGLVSIRSDKG